MTQDQSIARLEPIVESPMRPPDLSLSDLRMVYAIWILLFFEFHNFIPTLIGGGPVIRRLPLLLLVSMVPILLRNGAVTAIYWPFAAFVLLHLVGIPFSWNRGLALVGFKQMLLFFVPFTAALSMIRKPEQALTLYKLFLLSFLWYCTLGLPRGYIRWHNLLGNPDAFGALGAMAIAIGYHFALAAQPRKWRNLGFGVAMLGVLGVVASFARGAFLAAVCSIFMIWIRSTRRFLFIVFATVGLGVVTIAAELLYPQGEWWAEMATILKGTSEQTGATRWELWTGVGLRVFEQNPLIGVGAFNTGPVAVEIVPPGTLAGRFADPNVLYNKQMHNVYVQLLAEQGVVGILLWIAMTVGFFRHLRETRLPSAMRNWSLATGDQFDLRHLSFGLEAAMIAFLVGGVFYNQVYRHWFYTLLLLALLLSMVSRDRDGPVAADHTIRPPA